MKCENCKKDGVLDLREDICIDCWRERAFLAERQLKLIKGGANSKPPTKP